jgi:hypothetical protein
VLGSEAALELHRYRCPSKSPKTLSVNDYHTTARARV